MTESTRDEITAIHNVRVFNGLEIGEPTSVIISGGLIGCSNDKATKIIDAEGAVLLPGLIDCHIHLDGPTDLIQMAKAGVTTALDMGTWPATKVDSMRGIKGVTDIRSAGLPATTAGSVHSRIPSLPHDALVAGPDDAERFVLARIAENADYIKLIADVPGPDQQTLDAIVGAAHKHNKLVVAHAVATEATSMAQNAGADFITHVPVNGAMTSEQVNQMATDKGISVPTLVMMKKTARRFGKCYETCIKSVAALHAAGVPILAGTDANKSRGVPANVDHGTSMYEELELLIECGLSETEALRAATFLPAKHFGLHDRGRIEPGFRADLILISRGVSGVIQALKQDKRVWIAGQEI